MKTSREDVMKFRCELLKAIMNTPLSECVVLSRSLLIDICITLAELEVCDEYYKIPEQQALPLEWDCCEGYTIKELIKNLEAKDEE
jgi:hypothetical protein